MVKLVKSQVKCYKKKTKKNVGGQKKTYEYNQYLVPLKKSDNLDCSMDVFIIPKSDIKDFIDEEGELKDISEQEDEYKSHFAQYETELAELEWKHSKLSKSYKELLNKHNKTRRKQQEMEDKIKTLESDRMKLINALKDERRINGGIPAKNVQNSKPSAGQKSPESDKIRVDNEKTGTHASENKDDNDIWTALKSRLSKKEQEKKEE